MNLNVSPVIYFDKGRRSSKLQACRLSDLYFTRKSVNYKNAYIMGSASDIYFKFGPKLLHAIINDCHYFHLLRNRWLF